MFPSVIFFILLFFSNSDLGINLTFVSGQCLHGQKELLLELRTNLTYGSSSTKLVQWNESIDCCRWAGVKCDTRGRVSSLDLSGESISGGINDAGSSLFRLVFLENLSLAQNYFGYSVLPFGFGKLTELSYLNLSNSGFSGQIPLDFTNLTRLVVLDLTDTYFSSLTLENPDLKRLIQNFTRLRELYLDGLNISANGHEWCNAISSSLPNLRVLSLSDAYLTGPLDSSLLKLRSLSVIRLDGNSFSSPLPEFFAEFPSLRVLTMSFCGLSGVIPAKLFQVKSLETLDLSRNSDLEGSLPEFPLNSSLQTLSLSYTKFSGNVSQLGSLRMLSDVGLRYCSFSGPIPSSIKNLTQLVNLDLSTNQFVGSVPSFAFLKNLEWIDLSGNRLTGRIPDNLWEGLEKLEFLDLSQNSLEGELPASLFDLPSLKAIHLSNNSFSGVIRDSLNSSSSPLEDLELNLNNFEGPIPQFLFELQNLSSLCLSSNKFKGSLQLTDFRNLTYLDLSYNHLSVHVNETVPIVSLFPRLGTLMLASCNLQKFPLLRNLSTLMELDLSDNQLRGEIPNWLWEVSNGFLRSINLSHNQFSRLQEPYEFRSHYYLDLHSNMLRGKIPVPPSAAVFVDMSSNNFSSPLPANVGYLLRSAFFFSLANNKIVGTIPPSLCNATHLRILDLSNNRLHGRPPSCLFDNTLGVLNFRRNNLSGDIPDTFPVGCGLGTLDLSMNVLHGEVPKSLVRCTEMEVLNLGNNDLKGNFPCWLKNLTRLRVLVLSNNKFHGNISCVGDSITWPNLQIVNIASNEFSGVLPENLFKDLKALTVDQDRLDYLNFRYTSVDHIYYQDSVTLILKGQGVEMGKILNIFTSLDFSNNHFQGIIPETIGELKSLHVLNLSHNALSSHIPGSIGNLEKLESLDLSFNNLGGEIPQQLASITFLSFLNLSYNKLVGRIPQGSQMQTFPESSYLGNDGLCGFPLKRTCTDSGSPRSSSSEEDDQNSSIEHGIYVSVALGFVVGVGVIFWPLVFSKRWRKCYNKNVNKVVFLVLRRQLENEDW
ncbi:Receptor-like protein 6 [Sesamum alatum]|uniref:Receptor-like protein 6 n=1 Tax=Sesamum alatum TaxID=300844 RepID=A0AAE1XWI9_9LAMI|nr:Receptor-like protein 6 [Sesamum alatum]